MAESSSGSQPQQTHVTLTFDREVSEDELKQMQQQHDAVSALMGGGGHHDHDHPKMF